MLPIAVINKSSIRSVTSAAVDLMTRGIAMQLKYHVQPNVVIGEWNLAFYPDEAKAPAGAEKVFLFDHADQAGDLGYHDVGPDGVPYGRVFIQDVLDDGGSINGGPLCVATTLGHEILELTKDQGANLWAQLPDGTWVALELGDPVESDGYQMPVGSDNTWCTNFVFESWFSATGLGQKQFDFMQTTKAPFTMSAGGYMIVADTSGNVSQTFGHAYKESRMGRKAHPASRTARRMKRSGVFPLGTKSVTEHMPEMRPPPRPVEEEPSPITQPAPPEHEET